VGVVPPGVPAVVAPGALVLAGVPAVVVPGALVVAGEPVVAGSLVVLGEPVDAGDVVVGGSVPPSLATVAGSGAAWKRPPGSRVSSIPLARIATAPPLVARPASGPFANLRSSSGRPSWPSGASTGAQPPAAV
jgi:hypothetical protein